MKKIRQEQKLLTATSLSQLLAVLVEGVDDETLLALEAVRLRPSIGLGEVLKAEIYTREESQLNAKLSALYTQSAECHRSPQELRAKIDKTKADLRTAKSIAIASSKPRRFA